MPATTTVTADSTGTNLTVASSVGFSFSSGHPHNVNLPVTNASNVTTGMSFTAVASTAAGVLTLAPAIPAGSKVGKGVRVVQVGQPDPMQQAPLELGDTIAWSGTRFNSQNTSGGPGSSADMVISVNTIEASVGIFTQPQTLPVYTAIGEFGVGAFPAAAAGAAPPPSPAGALQEAQNRIFIETNLTDVTALADVYLVDKVESVPPAPEGVDWHRWLTPNDMTGTGAPGTATDLVMKGVPVVNVEGGGIITGLEGPQPGRARLRATRALAGILDSPTRNVRVVARTMCRPTSLPDGMLAAVASNSAACWQKMPAANGLFAGQYSAPTFEFIFPENVIPGQPIVPNNLYQYGFITDGDTFDAKGVRVPGLNPPPWPVR